MKNQIITMLTNQLMNANPQMYQFIEQARKNNGDPIQIFNQITSNFTPEQMSGLLGRARQMGIPNEVLNNIQNGIKTQ